MTVSPAATGVPLPAMTVCSMSCFGGPLAGNVTVGLVLNAPVTLIPVLAATGPPAVVDVLPLAAELDGSDVELDGSDVELDAADEAWELDEQALTKMITASSGTSSVDPTRKRARPTLPIRFHPILSHSRLVETNPPHPGAVRGDRYSFDP
jgi:hypothetical protein